ncbi:hypothetical protein CELL_01394 [Cellulomonas sp. T2.31MG-18]|uniref:DUF6448 family protein n=1 Tax=Cellulomonas sp. T2.31MG-18 TaxID=3157619 RepID=UPI0035E681B4
MTPQRTLTRTIARGMRAAARLVVRPASAHCDTEDGPVVKAGRRALISGDVNHALAWVHAADEDEVRTAFAAVAAGLGPERVGADRRFLETLVRLHRAGEGAGFDGIKPSGTPQPPAVTAADRALETGSLVPLHGLVHADRWQGVVERFAAASALKDHDNGDLPAARAAVAAYVDYVHYAAGHGDAHHDDAHHDVHAVGATGGHRSHPNLGALPSQRAS